MPELDMSLRVERVHVSEGYNVTSRTGLGNESYGPSVPTVTDETVDLSHRHRVHRVMSEHCEVILLPLVTGEA